MSRHEPAVDWTDERVAVIRTLWAEGKSAGQIAGYIGHPATRNAVMGKLYRAGLVGHKRQARSDWNRHPNQYSRHRATEPRRFSWEQRA